jgi:hypothetical protein
MFLTKLAALAVGLAAVVCLGGPVAADCLKDRSGQVICGGGPCLRDIGGEVWCAQFRFGSIRRTINGETLCGKGQCVVTVNSEVICSAVEGGGALKQSDGTTRCQGGCEYASPALCERTSAGW